MSNSITDFGSNQYWYTKYLICWYERRFPRSESDWNWNRFGSGSRNRGDLLYLMNEESVWKSSTLRPPPEYMIQQESHKGRLIETSGKIPTSTRNPADKVHYIVRFRDWRLTHSVTLALDVPKMGTIGSGELENRQRRLLCWHSSLPSPFRAYPKENPVPLGCEYLNRTNRLRGYLCFGAKQFELGSVMYYPYGRSSNWEDPSTWDEWKKQVFPRLYHSANSVPLNPFFMATYLYG